MIKSRVRGQILPERALTDKASDASDRDLHFSLGLSSACMLDFT